MVPVGRCRELYNTVVTTFGTDYATVSTQFRDGETTLGGRQMQTWAKLEGRWQVVAAHVSIDLSTVQR